MASVETLEDLCLLGDGFGALIGLGLAAELLPNRTSDSPVAAEVALETSRESDPWTRRDRDTEVPVANSLLGEIHAAAGASSTPTLSTADLLIPPESAAGVLHASLVDALGGLADDGFDFFPRGADGNRLTGSPAGGASSSAGRISLVPEPEHTAPRVSGAPAAGLVAAGAAASGDGAQANPQSVQLVSSASSESGFVSGGGGGIRTLSSENTPPDAVDDQFYTGLGQTVTLNVLDNDDDPDFDDLTITSVTQPPNGSVTFSLFDVTYTPDPGFGSGSDTFQYTISDGNGGSDTATVTVTMVEVTGFTVEWQQPDGTWQLVPAGEISSSEDNLRWTAQYSPSAPPTASEVHWLHKPWAERDNPSVPWTTFGLTACDCPAEENPGAGEWAIKPEVHFNDVPEQTEFVVALQVPESKLIMQVVSVEWVGHDPGDAQTNLSANPETGGGQRIFPGRNSIEGSAPDHRRVDFKVTVKPALMNLPVQITWKDPDDPTDSNGPIDTDPGLTDNNAAGGLTVPDDVTTSEIVGDTAIATGSVQVPLRYPGDNFRLVASPVVRDFDKIKAISIGDDPNTPLVEGETEARLFLDRNDDGDQDTGEPVIQEEGPATNVASPLLTIWRKVWVEVDSMGNVTTADPDDDVGDDHTPLAGDVPSPDTSEMVGAYADAFIQINVITDPDVSEPSLPFQVGFATQTAMLTYAGDHRQTPEASDYWSVYLLGIYEYGAFRAADDNDLNAEFGIMGSTNITATGVSDYSFVPMEIVADVADQWGWDEDQKEKVQQILAIHESGHQFGLTHTPRTCHDGTEQ